ncbi:hypothetical protein QG37_04653 [Candidozyma auris]|uniref:Uncharacterized protein n=1 Tax=Candidozyma auris TaxID=498019 RepID=A0A0L0NX13_CANAR|nr:hypothetical protein QG37_04653 [[Candida] auris]
MVEESETVEGRELDLTQVMVSKEAVRAARSVHLLMGW